MPGWCIKSPRNPSKALPSNGGKPYSCAEKRSKFFLGNLGAVEIFYNNQYLEAQAVNGVKSLIFPHELAKQAQIPFFTYDQQQGKFFLTNDSTQKHPPQ